MFPLGSAPGHGIYLAFCYGVWDLEQWPGLGPRCTLYGRLLGKYNFVEINRLKILLFLGVEYDWIDFKDNQTEPNHVKANMGPLGLIGVEIKF